MYKVAPTPSNIDHQKCDINLHLPLCMAPVGLRLIRWIIVTSGEKPPKTTVFQEFGGWTYDHSP